MIQDVFFRGKQLEILASLSLGVVESRNRNYINAQREFCHAVDLLSRSKGEKASALEVEPDYMLSAVETLSRSNFDKIPIWYKRVIAQQDESQTLCPGGG